MKPNIIEDFDLPKYIKGKSFAEASKAINNKFKDREGAEVERTKKELLSRLAEAQEFVKMQESLKANSTEIGLPQNQMFNGGRVPVQSVNELPQGQVNIDGGSMNPEIASGADIKAVGAKGATGGAGVPSIGGMTGIAGHALQSGKLMFGDTGVETDGTTGRQEKVSGAGMAASGALSGAAAGAAAGPIGAAVGAVVGGVSGAIGGSRKNKDILEGNKNAGLIENNSFNNDFALGGFTDPTDKELKKKDVKDLNSAEGANGTKFTTKGANSLFEKVPLGQDGKQLIDFGKYGDVNYFNVGNMKGDTIRVSNTKNNPHNAQTISQNMDYLREINPGKKIELDYNQYGNGGTMKKNNKTNDFNWGGWTMQSGVDNALKQNKAQSSLGNKFKEGAGKVADWTKENYGDVLRTAPIISNALQLKNLDKPDRVTLDRINSKYKRNNVDEKALENRVQNEATNVSRSLAGASNGSMGALRSNLLGASLNKTNALSDAYLKADDINRKEGQVAQQFDARNKTINLRQGTIEQQMNDQNEGAYNSAKSALQSQLATDIGNFGKEKVNMKQVAEMFGYKWDGEYFVDKEGKKIDPQTILNTNKNENK